MKKCCVFLLQLGHEVKTVSNIVPFSGSAIVDTQNVTGLLKSLDDPVIVVYTSLSKVRNLTCF